MSAEAPVLSIVIPSWNTRELLAACLQALERAHKPPTEVIVVENGSTDGSAQLVAERFPACQLLQNARNEGFARGCNQGMRAARGAFVLLLNSDTEVSPDALRRMLDFLEAHPDFGAVAPRLVHPDGATQRTVQAFPNLWTPLFFATPLERWFPNSPELRRYFLRAWSQEDSREIEQPPAACLLLRRAVLDAVGLFDEELWLFYNDVDLSRRMQAAGFRTWYLAEATVVHHVGASTAKFARFVPEWNKNRLAYYRKHHGRLAGAWVKACVGLAFLDWALAQWTRRLRRAQAERVWPLFREYAAFLAS
jgi:GT2 family glycosyltransferase